MVFRREREKEFSCTFDVFYLYAMERCVKELEAIGQRESRDDISSIGERLQGLLDKAQGKVTTFDLTASSMPEDATAKIPDPREKISR